jgi:hypothetical protein
MNIKLKKISGLVESNNFLRALWAELRDKFGKCDWSYQPRKKKGSKTISLGSVNINQKKRICISITYTQKTIVSHVHFLEQFDEPLKESSKLGQQLKDAVDKAYHRRNNPDTKILQVPIFSLYRSLAPYSAQWFHILPTQHPISLLSVKVKAFDQIDAEAEALRVSSYVLDILSVETNSLFWLLDKDESQDITSEIEIEELTYPEVNTFVSDEEWIEDVPPSNEYLLISSQAAQFLDRILSQGQLSDKEEFFMRACHHFHVAREQDMLRSNQLIPVGKQKNEDESITSLMGEDSRLKSAVRFSRRPEELATVLYMSTVEAAIKVDFNSSKKCCECGQMRYESSARVIDYVKKYLISEENNPLFTIFTSYYTKRSDYLHKGIVLRDHSYTRTPIPQLDSSLDSAMSQETSVNVSILRKWIGYMLRQQLKSM